MVTPAADILCSARAYKYSDILKLDRLVRKFDTTHLESNPATLEATDAQPFARESLLNALNDLGVPELALSNPFVLNKPVQ